MHPVGNKEFQKTPFMFILFVLTHFFAVIDAQNCFFPNTTANIFLNNKSMIITVWPLPRDQQASECSSLQGVTSIPAAATIGSYTFTSANDQSWSMDQPSSLIFDCSSDAANTAKCEANLTGSTVVKLELTYTRQTVSLVTTNVYYTLTDNSACWTDPAISVNYTAREICFLVTPSTCDLPQEDKKLLEKYEAFILMHLNTMPDAYLNVTLSSKGTSATYPDFTRPYDHDSVTRFCYSCDGVHPNNNNLLTSPDIYDQCVKLIDVLKVETAWSATLMVYVPIQGTTKLPGPITVAPPKPPEVVTPDTIAKAGITSAVKVSTENFKCYTSVTVQIYFGMLIVLLEQDTASICSDIMDYNKIILCGEVTDRDDLSFTSSNIRISLENPKFTFKQPQQFFPCTNVTCLKDVNRLLFSNLSLAGAFSSRYFSGDILPTTIIPFAGSVQRACFYRATLIVANDLVTLQPAERSPTGCSITEEKMAITLDIYIHSGPSLSLITKERLFVRMSGDIEYKKNRNITFTCSGMYKTGVYSSANVPKQDIGYYVSGSCPSKLKSVLEAYGNGTGVYAEISFKSTNPSQGAPNVQAYKEYQYIFIKESYFESVLISAGTAIAILICCVIALVMTYNKGHIMEP